MTVPERLEILRKHSPEVMWYFSPQSLQFIANGGKFGMKCTIGKDATRQSIIQLALKVQTELRGRRHGKVTGKTR